MESLNDAVKRHKLKIESLVDISVSFFKVNMKRKMDQETESIAT